jgi:hypothetical protein
MFNCNPTCTCIIKCETTQKIVMIKVVETLYKQNVGSLRYLCNNKPDIAFSSYQKFTQTKGASRTAHDPNSDTSPTSLII